MNQALIELLAKAMGYMRSDYRDVTVEREYVPDDGGRVRERNLKEAIGDDT